MGWENSAAGGSEEKYFYKNDHKYVVGIYYVDNSGDYIVMAEAENASGEKVSTGTSKCNDYKPL